MTRNAIDLLKADHEKVKGLLADLVETTTRAEKKRRELLDKIEKELHLHTHIEEEIFYPAFKDAGDAEHKRVYFEALEEHRAVDDLVLPDLKKTEPTSEKFSGRAKVLKELIEHHADEEEETMFKLARKALTREALQELGEQMEARKREMAKQFAGDRAA